MNDRACSKVISGPLTSGNDWPMTLHVWGTCFNGTLTGIRWDSDQMQDLAKNRVEVCKLGEFLRLVHFVQCMATKSSQKFLMWHVWSYYFLKVGVHRFLIISKFIMVL